MRRIILEAVAVGAVSTAVDVGRFVRCVCVVGGCVGSVGLGPGGL